MDSFLLNAIQARLESKLFVCLSVQKNGRRRWSINYGGENGLRNVGINHGLFFSSWTDCGEALITTWLYIWSCILHWFPLSCLLDIVHFTACHIFPKKKTTTILKVVGEKVVITKSFILSSTISHSWKVNTATITCNTFHRAIDKALTWMHRSVFPNLLSLEPSPHP